MKKISVWLAFFLVVVANVVYAKHPQTDHKRERQHIHRGIGHRADVSNVDNLPAGLQNKEIPYGLKKQYKAPKGWSKGRKKGW